MRTGSRTSDAPETRAKDKTRGLAFKKEERRLNPGKKALKTNALDSQRMGRIRQQHTKPEMLVRQIVSSNGYYYRTRNGDLPGSPDLANRKRRWAIFVHGCYWHHHDGCHKATVPKRNRGFWLAKFERNRERDRHVQKKLRRLGFRIVVVWECETSKPELLERRLRSL